LKNIKARRPHCLHFDPTRGDDVFGGIKPFRSLQIFVKAAPLDSSPFQKLVLSMSPLSTSPYPSCLLSPCSFITKPLPMSQSFLPPSSFPSHLEEKYVNQDFSPLCRSSRMDQPSIHARSKEPTFPFTEEFWLPPKSDLYHSFLGNIATFCCDDGALFRPFPLLFFHLTSHISSFECESFFPPARSSVQTLIKLSIFCFRIRPRIRKTFFS